MTNPRSSQTPRPMRSAARRRGAMMPIVAVVFIIFLVIAVFSIDVAYMQMVRSELRTATDAASRAGAEALSRTQNKNAAIRAAQDAAAMNRVGGQPFQLLASDIEIGNTKLVSSGLFQFVPNREPFNAVRVVGRRTEGSPNGSVPLFFAGLLGTKQFEPVQVATAARIDRDIALVLDVSGSMRHSGRFSALKRAVRAFMRELSESPEEANVSLIVYSTTARKIVSLTEDLEEITRAMDRQRPDGWTAIGEGLILGSDSLINDPEARPLALKTIVLMTDGNHNTGVSPLTAVDQIKNKGRRRGKSRGKRKGRGRSNRGAISSGARHSVNTITFSSGANESLMKQVADRGSGIHMHASSNGKLVEAFREMARQLPVVLTE